ncbi:MAG: hypothetical protein E6767_17260 [Dysgonomonas sp.]|nr:hypothetical protein [Dysgonomonas sp.]
MLVVLFSWIVISFVVISFGDILISLLNYICKKNEQYNIVDSFLLGTCAIAAILSMTSLWLPSNHYLLFAFIGIACIYWLANKERVTAIHQRIQEITSGISKKNWVFIGVSVFALLIYMSWAAHVFDAVFYHYQNIRWNEEFAVVPGVANIESRFGFNSNFLLVSAVFTFRFLFGEAIYTFQSVPVLLVLLWIFAELIRSNFELKRIILLVLFFFFFAVNIDYITDSSTDIIPNVFVFYLVARLVLYPDIFKNSSLLYFLIPVSLFTFKVSSAPICIVSLGVLVYYLKRKDYNTLFTFIVLAFIVIVPWISRTVIITGYLLYPLSAIDVFSFDWKLDKEVVDFESLGISVFARGGFNDFVTFGYFMKWGFGTNKLFLMTIVIMMIMCLVTLVSPFVIGYKTIKKKYLPQSYYWMYIALLIYTIYWYALAPDFRFANGAFFGMTFLMISVVLSNKENFYPKLANIVIVLFASVMLLSSFKRIFNYYLLLYPTSVKEGRTPFYSALYIPYSSKDQAEARHVPQEYSEYKMGDITLFITSDKRQGICYDVFPGGSSEPLTGHTRGPELSTIEPRGKTLQDGFKPKKQH